MVLHTADVVEYLIQNTNHSESDIAKFLFPDKKNYRQHLYHIRKNRPITTKPVIVRMKTIDDFIDSIGIFRGCFSKELNDEIEHVILCAAQYVFKTKNVEDLITEKEQRRYKYILMFLVAKGFQAAGYDFHIKVTSLGTTGGNIKYYVESPPNYFFVDEDVENMCRKATCKFFDDFEHKCRRMYYNHSIMCAHNYLNLQPLSLRACRLLERYWYKIDQLLDEDERRYIKVLSKDSANRQDRFAKKIIDILSLELAKRTIQKYKFVLKLCNQLTLNRC